MCENSTPNRLLAACWEYLGGVRVPVRRVLQGHPRHLAESRHCGRNGREREREREKRVPVGHTDCWWAAFPFKTRGFAAICQVLVNYPRKEPQAVLRAPDVDRPDWDARPPSADSAKALAEKAYQEGGALDAAQIAWWLPWLLLGWIFRL